MKTLIITGGSSGIGQAAALLFASRGWRVYELSRHDVYGHHTVSAGATACPIHLTCDVTDPTQCQSAVAHVIQAEGHIDVLISNAGMGISGPLEFATPQQAHQLMEVNVHGAMNITQAVLPHMRQQQQGRIIFVTSVAGVFSIPYQAWYSASKAALNSLASALRSEVRHLGIQVCYLQPGDVRTGFTAARQKSVAGSDVYPHAQRSVATMERDEQHGLPPEHVARQLYRLATARYVTLSHVSGLSYRLLCFAKRLVPRTLVNRVVAWLY